MCRILWERVFVCSRVCLCRFGSSVAHLSLPRCLLWVAGRETPAHTQRKKERNEVGEGEKRRGMERCAVREEEEEKGERGWRESFIYVVVRPLQEV